VSDPSNCQNVTGGGDWWWSSWVTPATTKDECVNQNTGRWGCFLPDVRQHLLWLDAEDCECKGADRSACFL